MSARRDLDLVWQELHWPQPLRPEAAIGLLRRLSTDARRTRICWEVRGAAGTVRFLVASSRERAAELARLIEQLVPGATVEPITNSRGPVIPEGRLHLTHPSFHLEVAHIDQTVVATLGALSAARSAEETAIQVVLGAGIAPSLPLRDPVDPTVSWIAQLLTGNQRATAEMRSSMRAKQTQFGFNATVRLGAQAPDEKRKRELLLGLFAGLRTLESGGVRMRLDRERTRNDRTDLLHVSLPLRLSLEELLALLAWPVSATTMPGLPAPHPKLVRPSKSLREPHRTFAVSSAPGPVVPLGISSSDSLFHTHLIGPTGSGKTNALLHLITHDMKAGRAVVVIDPKADLVSDVLARIPASRRGDVVLLDPTQSHPVGLNPLGGISPARAELVADRILSIFKDLFASSWGPRTSDVLHASLLTLAAHGNASLVWLPRLLTEPAFRRPLTSKLNDPIGLEPFWAQYESMSPQQQAQVIGPALSRLRQLLLRKSLRNVLGQEHPSFALSDVFTEKRILLVPLNTGQLGPEAGRLLGSLLVSELWQLTLARADLPPAARRPISIYVDEMQDYLRLPVSLSDALSQSRSLGVAWHLAHQYRDQLPDTIRAAVDANARNKVVFRLGAADAGAFAKLSPELDATDFMALHRFEIYASIMSDGESSGWVSGVTLPPPEVTSDPAMIIAESQLRYGSGVNGAEVDDPAMPKAKPSMPPHPNGDDEVIGRRPRGRD